MSAELSGKVVVVVGGTTGLGLSGALACVRAGAKVVVSGRDADNVHRAADLLGEHGRAVANDARQPGTTEELIAVAGSAFGRFDALYHVAGGSGRRAGDGPLHEITDDGWDFTLDLNLKSLFRSNRAAVQAFLAQGTPGVVLNMGSVLGYSPSPKFFTTHAYAATKSAIVGFTQACAAYYAPKSIRFNVIAPALVETPMAKRAAGDEEILAFVRTKQPLDGGRIGRPDDLDAAVVAMLASSFMTGQVLAVDGGWTVSEGQFPPSSDGKEGWL